jgi:hypothetical protein
MPTTIRPTRASTRACQNTAARPIGRLAATEPPSKHASSLASVSRTQSESGAPGDARRDDRNGRRARAPNELPARRAAAVRRRHCGSPHRAREISSSHQDAIARPDECASLAPVDSGRLELPRVAKAGSAGSITWSGSRQVRVRDDQPSASTSATFRAIRDALRLTTRASHCVAEPSAARDNQRHDASPPTITLTTWIA